MNIVNKLTTRHIQQNKGRTVVTTLGICVSVAMITAVFVAMASFLNLFGEIGLISSGKWDAEFDYLNQTQINQYTVTQHLLLMFLNRIIPVPFDTLVVNHLFYATSFPR